MRKCSEQFQRCFSIGRLSVAISLMLLLPAGLQASEDLITYVSLGVRLGWDFGDGMTFGGKMSVGILHDSDLERSLYANVTVGFKAPLTNRGNFWYREYNFIQAQFGILAIEEKPFFLGGGIGMMSSRHDPEMKHKLMLTLSAGALLFAEMDMIFARDKLVSSDLGLLAVLPMPVSGFDFGLR